MNHQEKFGIDNPVFHPTEGDFYEYNITQNADGASPEGRGENRAKWGNGLEFLMSCIAMSVGLGNIWRFPFTAYENGGGAFLIPYIIVLLVIGRPMYYMEMALGQFCSQGNVKMFAYVNPCLKGVGYGQLLGVVCVGTYYCSLMGLTVFYLINSFTANLPWAECKPEWEEVNNIKNITCIASKEKGTGNITGNTVSSSELWFTREVLKEKTSIDDGIGLPDWRLTLCLLFSWACIFVVSVKGVRSSGKAAYFLALFPYVVMIALLIRAATLEGAGNGILYFISPDWNKLATAEVWYAAITQCFFSLNVGFGTIIMYSSYNNFEHNINRDAMVVTTLDTFTSLLAGITIFGILGNLANELGVPVEKVINSGGTGLAFISYPEAIAKFEQIPWLFAVLFFFMLFILGIGSLVAVHGCANTMILDHFPKMKSWQVSALTSTIGFLSGIVYFTPGGQFVLTIVDHFCGTFIIFLLAVIEMAGVMWWYGLENFCNDIEFMLKQKVGIYWRISWGIITPLLLLIIYIYFVATLTRLSNGPYEIPDLGLAFGWAFVVFIVAQLLYFAAKYFYQQRSVGFPRILFNEHTATKWGPANNKRRQEWQAFKLQKQKEVEESKESWLKRKLLFLIGK